MVSKQVKFNGNLNEFVTHQFGSHGIRNEQSSKDDEQPIPSFAKDFYFHVRGFVQM
jgi:hypothetical protein